MLSRRNKYSNGSGFWFFSLCCLSASSYFIYRLDLNLLRLWEEMIWIPKKLKRATRIQKRWRKTIILIFKVSFFPIAQANGDLTEDHHVDDVLDDHHDGEVLDDGHHDNTEQKKAAYTVRKSEMVDLLGGFGWCDVHFEFWYVQVYQRETRTPLEDCGIHQ